MIVRGPFLEQLRQATDRDQELQELKKILKNSLIRSRVWYPGIDNQLENRVWNCVECQANTKGQSYEPMKSSDMPAGPWQNISADFYGPMDDGKYWFVNHCHYSRYIFVDELRSVAMDTVEVVLKSFFSLMGTPLIYRTDNGVPFNSHRFTDFATRLLIIYYYQYYKTISVSGSDRGEALQAFLRAYRETPHSTTKVAPAMLLFG